MHPHSKPYASRRARGALILARGSSIRTSQERPTQVSKAGLGVEFNTHAVACVLTISARKWDRVGGLLKAHGSEQHSLA